MQGLTGGDGWDRRVEYVLSECAQPGKVRYPLIASHLIIMKVYEFYIEMACNGMFGVGQDGMINAPDPARYASDGVRSNHALKGVYPQDGGIGSSQRGRMETLV
jgi:hypothetical protein